MTLEMVTDRERDKMYGIYASDPRARINVGIRRRLAPLMQNDRRRIELLTGLLLSMPGTPIIYYGDEMGMGDNVYLNDRDGVRTPMQWSIDRNGGFSRADPARMYLPPIMDPVYGFSAVNAESQGRSPSSATNWLRRLIAVRQAHKAFGRGTIEFLQQSQPQGHRVRPRARRRARSCASRTSRARRSRRRSTSATSTARSRSRWWAGRRSSRSVRSRTSSRCRATASTGSCSRSPRARPCATPTAARRPSCTRSCSRPTARTRRSARSRCAASNTTSCRRILPKQRWFGDKAARLTAATVVDNVRIGERAARRVVHDRRDAGRRVLRADGARGGDGRAAQLRSSARRWRRPAAARTRATSTTGSRSTAFVLAALELRALRRARARVDARRHVRGHGIARALRARGSGGARRAQARRRAEQHERRRRRADRAQGLPPRARGPAARARDRALPRPRRVPQHARALRLARARLAGRRVDGRSRSSRRTSRTAATRGRRRSTISTASSTTAGAWPTTRNAISTTTATATRTRSGSSASRCSARAPRRCTRPSRRRRTIRRSRPSP